MSIRIFEHLFRRKLLLVLPVILGGILGGLWAYSTYESHYESKATLWVDKPSDFSGAGVAISDFNPYLSPAANQANSMRELLGTNSFLTGISMRLDGQRGTPATHLEIRSKTAIWQYGNHVLNVAFSSSDPVRAAKASQAVIDEYTAVFAKQLKDQSELASTFYKQQAELAKTNYETATAELNAFLRARPQLLTAAAQARAPGSVAITDPELSKLVISQDTAEGQYDRMQSRYADSLFAATDANATSTFFKVIDPAEVPIAQVVPRKKTLLVKPVGGAMVGSLAALGLFLLSWRLDQKVRFATDLAFVGDVVVVTLPALRAKRRAWPESFVRMSSAIQAGIRDLSTRRRPDADGVGAGGAP
ncbi:MAG TPA: hypothetical protein VJB57_17450 [Dehalococcoidia bacterium]|nr:hypothetical protein [Dehalococcoidia bacterium]